ncbi:NuoI/complex I 23 kDa subunit family protein [Leptospira barantonii]|uniref:NADH-quinone oxidoreductase subunit I n=1 Tax=Leptospira barantonii TaxID=2023184 RepID=A0ABX4NJQ9_9LEPT|nr:NADH-quinone oxidoreductase subunit I [Leptospira barantonii]PJZ57056.1 NADH-quinone oxidoreductase subunit I [Leptospira barantonii]
MGTVNVVRVASRHKLSWYEKFYFYSIGKGLWITLKHFIKAAILRKAVTIEFPEKKRKYSTRFRGMHTMKRDEQGRERCTSCFCCMWICPADAIYIEAGEVTPEIQHLHPEDKYAKKFEIDLLRCIFCGMCEEACPKGAIYLDGPAEMATDNREDLVLTKERMMQLVGGPILGERL